MRRLFWMSCSLILLAFSFALGAESAKVSIREWDVPTPHSRPHDPAVAPDGSLWYTGQMANKLGRFDPKTGQFKEFPLKTPESGPHGLVADHEGNIWFTAVFKDFVGRLDPRTGQIRLKQVPTAHAVPYGIVVLPSGVPYFCEFGTNKLASIDPQTMAIAEYPLPNGARPRRLAVALDGTIYYSDYERGYLGHFDPTTRKVEEWKSPGGAGSEPYGITVTPDGTVWYSESGVNPNTLVRFDPKSKSFSTSPVPSGGGVIRNMAATKDGRVYLACSGVNKIGIAQLQ